MKIERTTEVLEWMCPVCNRGNRSYVWAIPPLGAHIRIACPQCWHVHHMIMTSTGLVDNVTGLIRGVAFDTM